MVNIQGRFFALLAIAVLFSSPVLAQRLLYHIDLTHASDHYIDVTLQPIQMRPDTMTFQMAVWAPGVYSTVHYGRFVKDFKARDTKGKELRVNHVSEDVWKIVGAENIAEIRYRVLESKSDDKASLLGLAKIDAEAILANPLTIFGYVDNDKGIPLTISYSLPEGWMIATPLSPATEAAEVSIQSMLHQTIYNAEDYEELADAPILAAPNVKKISVWHDAHADYYVIAAGDPTFPIDSFAQSAKRIARAEISFFHNWPFEEYMFLVYAGKDLPQSLSLSHEGSSVYALNQRDWNDGSFLQHDIAATMFKTWNGKRFHISELGPVEFSKPLSVKSLWFNEGASDYYADLILARYGLMDQPHFYKQIENYMKGGSAAGGESIENLSLGQNSYDEAARRALCKKGALAAMLMDIEIRDKTNNRSSLDAVLAKMNQDAKTGTTYDDNQLVEVIGKYAGVSLKDFDSLYIEGKSALPLDTYLALAGATRRVEGATSILPTPIGLEFALLENGAIIDRITTDTVDYSKFEPAALNQIGIRKGDTIVAVNGKKADAEAVSAIAKSLSAGKPVAVTVLKNKKPVKVTLVALHRKSVGQSTSLMAMKSTTPKQLAMRKALLGKRALIANRARSN